jgi:hypothetical protein
MSYSAYFDHLQPRVTETEDGHATPQEALSALLDEARRDYNRLNNEAANAMIRVSNARDAMRKLEVKA